MNVNARMPMPTAAATFAKPVPTAPASVAIAKYFPTSSLNALGGKILVDDSKRCYLLNILL